ncbi:hypothetical protein [Methanobacterium paludis]|uniref:Uncharacterized protein n=1 Tax=Methanobacterium paludis (strain DSM 25820 / JCM 18151 / SWAN1) TaxID=868131 RepID=F6D2T3_METPW|nr:hypothetical protein [Methanobacterium paludis]AEG18662.1 hypothetical protein MSWAN_1651 [Methanobacterium paludis]
MSNIILPAVQDDLNIVLEEILKNEKPSKQSLDQLEYDLDQLKNKLENATVDEAHEISNSINLIERLLKTYRKAEEATSPIRIKRSTKRCLKNLEYPGKINEGYDDAINFLINFYESRD